MSIEYQHYFQHTMASFLGCLKVPTMFRGCDSLFCFGHHDNQPWKKKHSTETAPSSQVTSVPTTIAQFVVTPASLTNSVAPSHNQHKQNSSLPSTNDADGLNDDVVSTKSSETIVANCVAPGVYWSNNRGFTTLTEAVAKDREVIDRPSRVGLEVKPPRMVCTVDEVAKMMARNCDVNAKTTEEKDDGKEGNEDGAGEKDTIELPKDGTGDESEEKGSETKAASEMGRSQSTGNVNSVTTNSTQPSPTTVSDDWCRVKSDIPVIKPQKLPKFYLDESDIPEFKDPRLSAKDERDEWERTAGGRRLNFDLKAVSRLELEPMPLTNAKKESNSSFGKLIQLKDRLVSGLGSRMKGSKSMPNFGHHHRQHHHNNYHHQYPQLNQYRHY